MKDYFARNIIMPLYMAKVMPLHDKGDDIFVLISGHRRCEMKAGRLSYSKRQRFHELCHNHFEAAAELVAGWRDNHHYLPEHYFAAVMSR